MSLFFYRDTLGASAHATPQGGFWAPNWASKNKDEWEFNQDFEVIENYSQSIKKGSTVFHQKYGYGNIISFEGEKAEIKFAKSSQKKVFLKYLKIID